MELVNSIYEIERPMSLHSLYNIYFKLNEVYGVSPSLVIPKCILRANLETIRKYIDIHTMMATLPVTIEQCTNIGEIEAFYNNAPLHFNLLSEFERHVIKLGTEQLENSDDDPLIKAFDNDTASDFEMGRLFSDVEIIDLTLDL